MTEPELTNIIIRAQQGDRDAFGLIFEEYSHKIYKFIFLRVRHREVSEDILSDTFIKAWIKLSQITSQKALVSWLYRVASNNIIDYYRLRKETATLEEIENLIEDSYNPVKETDLSLDQKRMLELMRHLPKEQAQVIQYRFFEDLTNAEIAHIMDKTEGAVRVVQHRAINNLKQLLNKQNHEKKHKAN
ncbi:MAG: hypothetical protein A3H72_03795 [Candidatus Doudnabacteria bacterium RIFCSPLOWO2_02_FULL_48_8]|uniref:RNA polymerase subunit sigma-70 n=1 Tax=Candidatus Doudnabacteria bacterium RIFCSPHIGHO2_01_FULL_46_24 TaxID=1817825 RepID=A0A1F5NWM5_9BACT|nr:MAG: hypothetical protein A2720_02030 [Candidatus Doudnabacteria bacterium RIFCSPHIGHO2_01_FULL_46_24]OGE95226.1 MAG: hypothetical protein A3H72_03795 [Candidatus Doudnabacteria bacterium RIFCSPLOWO2_02_FULL_48_8]OGE95793.1 MAG: hypothetical protein A3E98_04295 [Candidatus Doudnabacteria bacterium RIFCSPHIGHO2_12_FULL_48_11]